MGGILLISNKKYIYKNIKVLLKGIEESGINVAHS